MDPISTIIVDEDTTFALMLEAQARGHDVSLCQANHVFLRDGKVFAGTQRAEMKCDAEQPVTLQTRSDVALSDVDAIFVRKDPPFDREYLWLTLLLERLRGETLVVNDPRGLRDANEKLYACHFPELMPATLVSNESRRITDFVNEVGGKAVIKPIDGHGGEGIFGLTLGDKNFNAAIETVTDQGRRLAMIQEFIPEVGDGDKRILFIESDVLGAIMRVPPEGELRSNIHVGGRVEATTLTARDHHIVEVVSQRAKADGLWFVGLDVIGGRLTEVNVTSPTGIQQMSRLQQENLEMRVIIWIENQLN